MYDARPFTQVSGPKSLNIIDNIFCIPIIQDVIEHVICHNIDTWSNGDATASKLANVHTLEVQCSGERQRMTRKIFNFSNSLLDACDVGTLRNISFRFRGCQPSIWERQLQDAHKIEQLQQRILDLSPKFVTFDVDACGNRTRQMFLSAAEITKNMLEKSFPKLFGQGIAKIVVVEGGYKLILAHTGRGVFNINTN